MKEIKGVFASLEKKIVDKAKEIVREYEQVCAGKIEEIEQQAQESSDILERIKLFQSKVQQFLTFSESIPATNKQLQPSKVVQSYE